MTITFTKMQGLGNDFVVIDATVSPFQLTKKTIQQMADRRFGIGFDQLLVIEPSQIATVDYYYRIFNADGGEVAQCGNGARCIARYVNEMGLTTKKKITVQTKQSKMNLELLADNQVKVTMGRPKFSAKQIPMQVDQVRDSYTITIKGNKQIFSPVNLGNPHAVFIVKNIAHVEVDQIGKALNDHPMFPEGINVGFMQVIDQGQALLRVYERGTGETLACGSGACAAFAIGKKQGLLNHLALIKQTGGDLTICWPNDESPIEMIGPAEFVYFGEWLK